MKLDDLTGREFRKWTVIERDMNRKNPKDTNTYWICKCKCGVIKSICSGHLTKSKSESCRVCSNHKNKNRISSRMWSRLKLGARARNLEVNLGDNPKEYLYQLLVEQKFCCALTGQPIVMANTIADDMHGGTSASPDRIDSNKGYVIGNVQWVHKDVNKMKWDYPQEYFIETCRKIAERFPIKP